MTADQVMVLILAVLGAAGVAGAAFFVVGRRLERRLAREMGRTASHQAEQIMEQARREAESAKQEAILAAKQEILQLREQWDREATSRRDELDRHEERLEDREALIDRKLNSLDDQQQQTKLREQELVERTTSMQAREAELDKVLSEQRRKLEQVSGLSAAEAKQQLVHELTDAARAEAAAMIREVREDAKRTADREARKLIALAVQRVAADHATETTVSAISLPNDEMKGRIIGREGRNIRAFETATGVDVIIDDTPDTVVVSCFDPVRREVARRALEQLIADGRIHPGRIEEVVEKAKGEVEKEMQEAGEEAIYDLGIRRMHPELVKLLGRMKYRTSYGQNMLAHSQEVAWLAGIMATELKLDVHLAKRAALLHDIGKVLTHQHEGTHVELGVELAKRFNEHPVVINAIAAHHDDAPHETPISVIVQAADAVSGARPGARREAFETYVKRLAALEGISTGFKGVEKAYAIQAGREIRIAVLPDAVSDAEATELSEQIARRIESELQYPGQIKVVVIRETRAVDFAR